MKTSNKQLTVRMGDSENIKINNLLLGRKTVKTSNKQLTVRTGDSEHVYIKLSAHNAFLE